MAKWLLMGHVSATKSVVTVQGSHKHFIFLGSVMSDHVLSTNPIPPILSTILDPWSLKWFAIGLPAGYLISWIC